MSRLLFILFGMLIFPMSVLSDNSSVKFIYSGFDFYIPGGASIIGTKGGRENFTFFRYGSNNGKEFLAFSDISKDDTIEYGCDVQEFYAQLAGRSSSNSCSQSEIASFKKYFVGNSDTGEWSNTDFTSYYFSNNEHSFLFVFKDDKVIKIDSDFMDKNELKRIISQYVD
ncbi:hypothetical protein [Alkalimarinus coralli]|uniref:hypothetical protein n=1 Tax=Alkalimarinus coralli TaxID=2935863 RepID=UPI00202B4C00|nr:hypothetical protein [Alkalimarinus coralli]